MFEFAFIKTESLRLERLLSSRLLRATYSHCGSRRVDSIIYQECCASLDSVLDIFFACPKCWTPGCFGASTPEAADVVPGD